jgi:Tfp pilus assembly protein PilF
VLGSLGDGGYLLYEGGEKSVFVDGRLEVYGSEIVESALRVLSAGQNLTATLSRLGVQTAVLRLRMEPVAAVLDADSRWVPVYFDRSHVVYVQLNAETRETAGRLAFDWSDPPVREPSVPAYLDPPDMLAGFGTRVPDVTSLELQGGFLIRRGNLDLAENRFRRALAQVPSSPTSRLHLGMIEEARGREEKARALFAGLDASLLESEEMLGLRSWIAALAGNTARAYELGKQAAAGGAADPVDRKNLARLAIRNQQFEQARSTLVALDAEFPSDPEIWGLMGDLEFIRQSYDEALGHYATALALGASQARIHFNIGTIHARRRRFAEARVSFEEALATDPDYARARQGLQQLESMGF